MVQDVPRPLQPIFKRKRLIQSLKTHELDTARRRRVGVLAAWESEFEQARQAKAPASVIDAALRWRQTIQKLTKGDTSTSFTTKPVEAGSTPAENLLSVADWAVDDEADQIADTHGPDAAEAFAKIARSLATPIKPFIEEWLNEQDIEDRSKRDHRLAVRELFAWADSTGTAATIEAFDRRTAGRYVSHLLGQGMDRQKTVSKRIWSLSSLWRWLQAKGHTETNVWRDHGIGGGRSAREKHPERPFTPAEIHKLLNGTPKPVLGDMMRLALYSGARIEELSLLRVSDINPTDRTMTIQADPKTPASRRAVPIHSQTWPIIAARIANKPADAFVLHELGPAPKPGRSRSMPVSKAFGYYRADVGVDDKHEGQRRSLVNFHSFRRTFVTLAEQAGQPEPTIRSVIGHKRQGMTFGLYSGGPSLEQRRACVEAVRLPDP